MADHLRALGWTVLARNVHLGRQEIDIVALDPGPPAAVVIVEVRWRVRRDFGLPEDTFNWRKRAHLRAALGRLLEAGALPDGRALPSASLRVDLVVVEPPTVAVALRACVTTDAWPAEVEPSPLSARPSPPHARAHDKCYTPRPARHVRADSNAASVAEHTRATVPTGAVPDPRARSPAMRMRGGHRPNRRSIPVPNVSMRQLLEAGVHFGHQTRRWNPKMKPYIFAERNGIHIIDLAQTVKGLEVALAAVSDTVARGEQVLFVGTKKQAQEPVAQEAGRAGQPWINKRWLGGMLTNFVTIKKRIALMEQLEARQAQRRLRADVEEGSGRTPGGADR